MELLAPAGGPEQLRLATHFGADAVYLAGKRWGMRARSDNFTDDELADAVRWAHGRGVSVHVALNVVMNDADMDELPSYLRLIDEIGVDAAIVADLGALMLLREHAPHVEAHLSTQASVMSAATADAWARLGVRRVVLAREMTLAQIAELRRRCSRELELEVFAHGSMCMAYSGRCLLSSALMGPSRSASRGACAQPCRWGWSLVEEQAGAELPLEEDERGSYLLSSNDLCMIDHLDELAEAGVDAIKLEGRAKGSYYTACVTNAYRHVLDGAPVAPWRSELDAVSHRPYSTSFFFGNPEQNPGRVDYARERLMVGLVRSSEADFGAFVIEVECRNRAVRDAEAQVLSPWEDVRRVRLSSLEEWSEKDGAWVPVDVMDHNMGRYRFRCPFPLSKRDLVCI
ncbi:MAG: U32 family peptidase [Atopobiaceae bacterium]|nr:U32 family peptidase [Atopobiaceae bacterium]